MPNFISIGSGFSEHEKRQVSMGVDHGGKGDKSPQNLEREDANTNCPPPRFCHIGLGTKMSVLWPSKYAKIRFRPELHPGPRRGSSRRSPRPLSRLERGHPSPYAIPLDTDPPSALAMRPPPQKSSQIYAYASKIPIRKLLTNMMLRIHNLYKM